MLNLNMSSILNSRELTGIHKESTTNSWIPIPWHIEKKKEEYRGGTQLNPVGTIRNQLLHDSRRTKQREQGGRNVEEYGGREDNSC